MSEVKYPRQCPKCDEWFCPTEVHVCRKPIPSKKKNWWDESGHTNTTGLNRGSNCKYNFICGEGDEMEDDDIKEDNLNTTEDPPEEISFSFRGKKVLTINLEGVEEIISKVVEKLL